MKNFKTLIFTAATAMVLASCGGGMIAGGPAGNTQAQQTTGNEGLLGSLIGGLLGNLTPINAAALKGSWTYSSPECRFESENLLTKAGGAVVASQVETKLSSYLEKMGIRQGVTTIEFDGNNACSIVSGNAMILSGTYTVDPKTRAINIKGTTGLLTLSGTAYLSGNTLTLLFDSTKMLGFMKSASALLGGNTSSLGSLFDYDGMQLGMNLTK